MACEISEAQRQPRPTTAFIFMGEPCSFNQLKVMLTDAALIGFDAELRMDEGAIWVRSDHRTVSFPRKIMPDGVSVIGDEWKEEDHTR
jgi:hypothetical protein